MVIKWYLFKCTEYIWAPAPQPKLLFKGKCKLFSMLSVFREILCLGLAKKPKQTGQRVQGGPPSSVLHRRWVKSLWYGHLQRQKDLAVTLLQNPGPPQEAGVLHPNLPCATWSHTQRTVLCLSKLISPTDDRKEMWLQEQTADTIFYFIINCTTYCIFVQIRMSQTSECPLFASHRSLLNQMFLIL